ncbi:Agouti-related protein, partial [Anabarilius grahami]
AQETTPPSTDQHHVSFTSHLKEPYKSRSLVQTLSLGRGTLQDLGKAVRLQRRGTRSPSRCIPHQQSCLGHHLPCCNPCDTCYCRFFKAFCYCRSMDHTCKN